MSATWSHGICGCFSDISICLITFFVPCLTAGRNAEHVGESCIVHCLFSLIPLVNIWCHASVRGKIRDKKGIEGTFFNDLILACLCSWCAYAQESLELKAPVQLSMARE